ncbi:hypothetical protein FHX42_001104 [Saccharopolyspora lacisalsi]|uniref:Uncharacterized protein n=1 Tax=Halosaccharopolyspora lacisalsi TaxID=1000566 RepID=A0A839DWR1_9PSEU|nr:hypothetical protein [Halosaccharopolyspora lacisalsi]
MIQDMREWLLELRSLVGAMRTILKDALNGHAWVLRSLVGAMRT